MKKYIILFVVFTTIFVTQAFAQFEGTVGLGIHAGYGSHINSLSGGVHIHYYRTNRLRFAPAFTYNLPRKGNSMWIVDADAHYIIPVSVSASLYPIAGASYSNWKYTTSATTAENWTKHRIGANLGVGVQHDIAYRVRANFELKYQFMKDFSQIFFMGGIGFWF